MHTKSLITLFVLVLLQVTSTIYAEDEPPCGVLCGLCPPVVLKLERWATITYNDFMPSSWASCEGTANCCSPSYTCQLYVSQKTVSVGAWMCESGINFGITLPEGFSLGANGSVSYNGQTTVSVEAGVKAICNLQRCQTSTLKVGPYYRWIVREVQCYKMCFNPKDLITPCIEYQTPCTDLMGFKKYSSLIYILDACKVLGECGIPYYGSSTCPYCANPYNPTCP